MGNSTITEFIGNGNWRATPTGNAHRWRPATVAFKPISGFWMGRTDGRSESQECKSGVSRIFTVLCSGTSFRAEPVHVDPW